MRSIATIAFLAAGTVAACAFEKQVLTDKYYCDGINHGDINRDGKQDIVAGPFWYAGPDFKTAHAFYKPVVHPLLVMVFSRKETSNGPAFTRLI